MFNSSLCVPKLKGALEVLEGFLVRKRYWIEKRQIFIDFFDIMAPKNVGMAKTDRRLFYLSFLHKHKSMIKRNQGATQWKLLLSWGNGTGIKSH